MLLIINSGIILTLLIIVLFNITNTKKQILTSLIVVIILILFKIICDRMIVKNKKNIEPTPVTEKVQESCAYTYNKKNNSFDLNYLDNIIVDLKDIVKEEPEKKRIEVDKTGKKFVFCKDSSNENFHYKDLHNKTINARLNVSDKKSLLLNNVDCANDTSCIIQPSIYNFHKY